MYLAIFSIIIILLFAYLKKQLTFFATITAFLVGLTLYFCGGLISLICLYMFFITSVISTNVKKEYKRKNFSFVN